MPRVVRVVLERTTRCRGVLGTTRQNRDSGSFSACLRLPPSCITCWQRIRRSCFLLAGRWPSRSAAHRVVVLRRGVSVMIWVIHGRAIRDGDEVALGLAKRWSKVAAVLFAVGAVSGTILSFEMGLLWPQFMRVFGDVIGLPFALEGIAFFLEAIFLGIYLYGWDRMPPRQHRAILIPIALSGVVGTFCILAVNSWMNSPTGFHIVDGKVTDVDPWAAMFNHAVWLQFLHMWIATVMVVGFLVAAVYATGILRGRDNRHHRLGLCCAVRLRGNRLARPARGRPFGWYAPCDCATDEVGGDGTGD